MDSTSDPRDHPSTLLWMTLAALIGAAGYFWVLGDPFTAASLALIGFTAFSGYRLGATRFLAFVLGISLAVVWSPDFASFEPKIAAWFGAEGTVNRLLCNLICGAAVALIATLMLQFAFSRLLRSRPTCRAVNRAAGMGIGVLQGVAVIVLFAGGILIVEPIAREKIVATEIDGPKDWVHGIVDLSDAVQASVAGPWLAKNNPFERIPRLRHLQRRLIAARARVVAAAATGDQANVAADTLDPVLANLLREASHDPQVQAAIRAGGELSFEDARKLLESPALASLLQDPNLLESLTSDVRRAGRQ